MARKPPPLRLKMPTLSNDPQAITPESSIPPPEKEVCPVGELPDWLDAGLEHANSGDGPERYSQERSARADIPKALDRLKRAGVGNPPVTGDELPEPRT
jgi:hypothetical protein